VLAVEADGVAKGEDLGARLAASLSAGFVMQKRYPVQAEGLIAAIRQRSRGAFSLQCASERRCGDLRCVATTTMSTDNATLEGLAGFKISV
jgi:hypothetical protein